MNVLASFGATVPEIEELLLYNKNVFVHDSGQEPVVLPIPDEPFVAAWEKYAAEECWQEEFRRIIPRKGLYQDCFMILSDGAFRVLQALVKRAAENLERFDHKNADNIHNQMGMTLMLVALARLTLDELASQDAEALLNRALCYANDRYDYSNRTA